VVYFSSAYLYEEVKMKKKNSGKKLNVLLTIKKIGINGEGIGYYKKKITFVKGALPDEVIVCEIMEENFKTCAVSEESRHGRGTMPRPFSYSRRSPSCFSRPPPHLLLTTATTRVPLIGTCPIFTVAFSFRVP